MDTKKAIQTLIKIAENQQKIINRLAQAAAPPPDHLAPDGGAHTSPEQDVAAVQAALPADIKGTKLSLEGNNVLLAHTTPGKMDAVFNGVQKTMSDLYNSKKIQTQFTLKVTA